MSTSIDQENLDQLHTAWLTKEKLAAEKQAEYVKGLCTIHERNSAWREAKETKDKYLNALWDLCNKE